MIKANKKTATARELDLTEEDIALVADLFSRARDSEGVKKQNRVRRLENEIRDENRRIENSRADIESRERDIVSYQEERDTLTREIAEAPAPVPYPVSGAKADLERARALPWVKSLSIETITVQGADLQFIVAKTRANSLVTTLDKKYSRSERWYKAKPYKIALPAYNIRIGLMPHNSCALESRALGLALADSNDTAHFLSTISRYKHEVHPHWGTTSVPTDNTGEYRGVCLGEYESEVSGAFRRSIAEGLIAFAVYLQTAGSSHAYIAKREIWALWLGKAEYNVAIVPSAEEEKTLGESAEDSDDCTCYDGEDRTCDDDCDCECDCHS